MDSERKIATASVVAIGHDDNQNKIPHAHIVVNNLDLKTENKIQFKNQDIKIIA